MFERSDEENLFPSPEQENDRTSRLACENRCHGDATSNRLRSFRLECQYFLQLKELSEQLQRGGTPLTDTWRAVLLEATSLNLKCRNIERNKLLKSEAFCDEEGRESLKDALWAISTSLEQMRRHPEPNRISARLQGVCNSVFFIKLIARLERENLLSSQDTHILEAFASELLDVPDLETVSTGAERATSLYQRKWAYQLANSAPPLDALCLVYTDTLRTAVELALLPKNQSIPQQKEIFRNQKFMSYLQQLDCLKHLRNSAYFDEAHIKQRAHSPNKVIEQYFLCLGETRAAQLII